MLFEPSGAKNAIAHLARNLPTVGFESGQIAGRGVLGPHPWLDSSPFCEAVSQQRLLFDAHTAHSVTRLERSTAIAHLARNLPASILTSEKK